MDQHVDLHKFVGCAIVFFSVVHTLGHTANYGKLPTDQGILSEYLVLYNKNSFFSVRHANPKIVAPII